MSTDPDLHELFHSATADLDLPVARLVAGGTERGRRLRRRRTVLRAVGGMTAATVVAPLAWVGVDTLVPGSTGTPENGTAAPPAVAASTALTPVDGGEEVGRIPAFDDEGAARELTELLGEMAPGLTVEKVVDNGQTNRSATRAIATVSDGTGRGQVEFTVWPKEEGRSAEDLVQLTCHDPDRPADHPEVTCTEVEGGTLATTERSMVNDQGERYVDLTAELLTLDALRVQVRAANAAVVLESLSPTRPEAPLTLDQVVEIARDPRWIAVGEPEAPPVQPAVRDLAVDATTAQEELLALVRTALPGATVTGTTPSPSGWSLSAAVSVDDGQGPSHVQVSFMAPFSDFTFHQWLDTSGPCIGHCVETAVGHLVTEKETNDEKADEVGVYNRATYQRADGVMVTVTSSNTAGPQHEATRTSRPSPPLSTEQLAAIAQSDVWVE